MNLGWYLARLRNMRPAEIAHRVGERLEVRRLRRVGGWNRYADAPRTVPLAGLREAFLAADAPQRAALAEAAGKTLDGRFEALGRAWPGRQADRLFPAALWRLDPVSGGAWPGPDTFCFDIDVRANPALGDVKYVWEINRLQVLVPLAARVLLDDDAVAARAIEAAVASWYAANPPFGGVGWAAGIEIALRSISLALVATLAADRLDGATLDRIAQMLVAGRHWLERFPSLHSSANNHRIAELAGLHVIAMAQGRRDAGARDALVAETLKQILPDGVGAEQTPTYAAFTVELALLCASLARAAGEPFPADFDRRLAAFLDWIVVLGGGGRTPAIGDDDEGRALTLGTHEADYPRSVAAAVAGYLRRAGPEPEAGDLRALVFGRPSALIATPEGLRTFPAGGYSTWSGTVRGHRLDLIFDHGPLGYLSIAAHGHADALSLILSIDGEPVLVDPGTYLYGSGGDWRRWFRGTAAHNTLSIGGADQSLMAGPFNWAARANARLDEAAQTPALRLTASHDGYRRRFAAIHQRTIEAGADGLTVTDRLSGRAHEAEIVFQLAAGLEAELDGSIVDIRRDGAVLLRIAFPSGAVSASRGGEGPAGGWVCPRFGVVAPAWRLAWRGPVDAGGVATQLAIGAPTPAPPALDTHPAQT